MNYYPNTNAQITELNQTLRHILESQEITREKITLIENKLILLNNKIDNLTNVMVDLNDDIHYLKDQNDGGNGSTKSGKFSIIEQPASEEVRT
jgi:chromosome segregation ATPase